MTGTHNTKKRRLAHHEAGHAVLSAAINDAPHLVSILGNATSLGRSRYDFEASPPRLVQVHLAGFAAEELMSGRSPRQLRGPELGLSIAAAVNPGFISILSAVEGCDQQLAVQEILKMDCACDSDSIREAFERFYVVARASVKSVWPAVVAVAQALLEKSELESDAFFEAIRGHDLYDPVIEVQRAHGL